MYNVFLSGGGLKGAYQYGFFKELYKSWPDIKINKVYAVSVGAVNSIPIVTRRMDALDKFWNDPAIHPFDTIVQDWDEARLMSRMKAFIKHGSIFKEMKREPYERFLKELNVFDWQLIQSKLVIISFDKQSKKTIFLPCIRSRQTIDAIQSSALYPGLFDARNAINIDGMFANIENIVKIDDMPWICLDLQNDNPIFKRQNNAKVFHPTISEIPLLNETASLLSNRFVLDHLIDNGRRDATLFVGRNRTEDTALG
jgi:predicted acylesterase/phospholipase RssA